MKLLPTPTLTIILAALVSLATLTAYAEGRDRRVQAERHDRHFEWRGDIRSFHERDFAQWRGGQWFHGYHDGRLGWWWTVGPMFYWYERPLYPYPDPYLPSGVVAPPTYVQQPELIPEAPPAAMVAPPPATNWYYCAKPEGYYPYVTACPGGWKIVPATPPAPKR